MSNIAGYITIDNYGSLLSDGKLVVNAGNDWKHSVHFTILTNTTMIYIDGGNTRGSQGAALASFSNGVVTDTSWECIKKNSNDSTAWPKAISYGTNIRETSPWRHSIANISTSAHWIWTKNSRETAVLCRKSFSELTPCVFYSV